MNVKIHIGGNQQTRPNHKTSDKTSRQYSNFDNDNFHNTIWQNRRSNFDSGFKVFSATPSVTIENIQDIIDEDKKHFFKHRN